MGMDKWSPQQRGQSSKLRASGLQLSGAHGPSGPLPALEHEKEPSKKDAVGDDSGKLSGAHGHSGPLPTLGHEKEPSKKDAVGAGLDFH